MAMNLWLDPCGNHAFYRLKHIITLCIASMTCIVLMNWHVGIYVYMLIEATIKTNLYQSPKLIDQNLGKWMILRVLSGHFPHTQN